MTRLTPYERREIRAALIPSGGALVALVALVALFAIAGMWSS